MAFEFVNMLNTYDIEYIVAPYEADAQLAYLDYINYIDCVCTIDSDLLAYGCKEVLYNIDFKGNCKSIRYNDIFLLSFFNNLSSDDFLKYCILSGCDYFKCAGIGSRKALLYINKLEQLLDDNELINFKKAYITFKLQIVYCPLQYKTRYLTSIDNLPDNYKELAIDNNFYGTLLDDKLAYKIAKCAINPITYQPFTYIN